MSKILYYIHDFPQLSQTYVWVELERVARKTLTDVIAMQQGVNGFENVQDFQLINDLPEAIRYVKQTAPDVLHSHWLYMTKNLFDIAKATDVPFTIRAHSFDVLPIVRDIKRYPTVREILKWVRARWLNDVGRRFYRTSPWYLHEIAGFINHPLCLGILSFPFSRENLEMAGINSNKIHDCYPVVDFQRFYNRGENGNDVMLAGIIKKKKNMKNYFQLAKMQAEKHFNLYSVGNTTELDKFNQLNGGPVVRIKRDTPFHEMPNEYKKHQWMVIPTEGILSTSGWPIIVAEAQAAGVVVCMQNSRSDLKEYIGEAGYLFDSVNEVSDIIKEPPSPEVRERGFIQAQKSDIDEHIQMLFELWKPAIGHLS